jgi:hypothetical protein
MGPRFAVDEISNFINYFITKYFFFYLILLDFIFLIVFSL